MSTDDTKKKTTTKKTKKPVAAKRSIVRVHVEYGENEEHTTYSAAPPAGLSFDTYLLIAKGMLFANSWVLDDSNGHNWSVWVDGICYEAHGEHKQFPGVREDAVAWLYGEVVEDKHHKL